MREIKRWAICAGLLGAALLVWNSPRTWGQGDGLDRITQTSKFSYSVEVMENGRSKDLTRTYEQFLDAHTAKGVVFHVKTQAVFESPLGDRRAALDIGGQAQLIQVTELRPGALPMRHRYGAKGEPLFLAVQGRGTTRYWEGTKESEIQWKANDLFAVPPGSWIEHTVASGTNSARLLEYIGYGVNTYTAEQVEEDRSTPAEGTPQERERLKWAGNYFENVREAPVLERDIESTYKRRVIDVSPAGHKTHTTVLLNEIPPGGNTKPPGFIHRHGGQATYFVLKGRGYNEIYLKNESPKKYTIAEGDIIGYPAGSYHHYHFNTSQTEFFRLLPVVPKYEKAK